MRGKRVFITGGNSGIGLVTASELAKRGAEIVLACKPSKKTDLAVSSLNSVSSVPVIKRVNTHADPLTISWVSV